MNRITFHREIRVKEVLGNFCDSKVNKAEWDNKTIAIKKYKYDEIKLFGDAYYFKYLKPENILKFYDVTDLIDDHYYLLMEYADCGSLDEQIHGAGVEKYTRDTALNWMYQCAKGLAFLHEHHTGHYNIKPRNLFFTKNFRQLKIGELGIHPRLVEESKSREYMPPEGFVLQDLGPDPKYDVFSFGMVLWEVLTRRKPLFEMRDDFNPFLEDLPSDNIRSLIESCWNFNPLERPRMERVAATIALEIADIKQGETIGFGSFGVVYKAQLLDVPYAVKEFHVKDDDAKKGIEREVKYLSRTTHRSIIKLFGTKLTKDSKTLILMELADCGSLYDRIHQKEDYSDCFALRWMCHLAEGLEYLHAMEPRPIIHRDIKTSNLLLTDNYEVLKIADFGTVRELATLMTEKYVGTAEYTAPEVGLDWKYSKKSDVYSFGIVLWEVMSRKKPFYHLNNKNPLAIMNLVSKGERPPIEDAYIGEDIRTVYWCDVNSYP
ncbi:hypothetical protein ACLKA6_018440 [Drosophila palustris]